MSKHFRGQKARLILVMTLLMFGSAAAEAAFVKKAKLKPTDVKRSVSKALKQIPGSVTLDKIEGVHQNTSRNLKGKEELLNNTATIYAVVSGTIGLGQPLVFDGDVELVHCSQLNDQRWICRFTILNAAIGSIFTRHFFLEK